VSEQQPDPPGDSDLPEPDESYGSDLDPRTATDEDEQTPGADEAGP
jgi:hypothetical protein